jgi:DNA-binding TFAR19-related protein (PDSD5 family)
MTREEAIAFFKDMNECTYGNLEAVEMAIKALKQQDEIIQIIDDCDLEAWEILAKIKEAVRA